MTKPAAKPAERRKRKTISVSGLQQLDELIGLSDAKRIVRQAVDYGRAQQLYIRRGFQPQPLGMHMAFSGNPGTAKTTVARLVAQIFKENGILSKGKLIEVGRSDLIGKYVGWTAKQVKEVFNSAKGSVLFIDEAYSLVDDQQGQFGDEAINTIVQEMENNRQNMVVIFAGYQKPMQEFLSRNPGLRSRVTFQIPFPDYTEEELMEIFRKQLRDHQRKITAEDEETIRRQLQTAKQREDFGNGRDVRNLVEKAIMAQASRLMQQPEENITDDDIRYLKAGDFDEPIPEAAEKPVARPIGFCC